MGRQHTTWISEENWNKLQKIGGDSVSAKIGNAIAMADPDRELTIDALKRQLERAKEALREINFQHCRGNSGRLEMELEDVEWLWRD